MLMMMEMLCMYHALADAMLLFFFVVVIVSLESFFVLEIKIELSRCYLLLFLIE